MSPFIWTTSVVVELLNRANKICTDIVHVLSHGGPHGCMPYYQPLNPLLLQSTLVISKLKGPSKHSEISVIRHIRFSELRQIQSAQPNFTNEYVIRLLYLEIYIGNIVEKGRNCSRGAISPLIDNTLLPDVRFKHGLDFLFEISGCSR